MNCRQALGLIGFLAFITVFCVPNRVVYGAEPDFSQLDAYIEKEMRQCRIPGLSLGIVRGDEIVYLKGYGRADNSGRQVTPQTPFLLASLSKSFTALGILQLVDDGMLDLDEPVRSYVPWFELSDSEASSRITVRQLLNHTSGLGSSAEFEVATLRGDDTDIEQIVRNMKNLALGRGVGEAFQYNNANYIILGQVIQSVSGLSYPDYIIQKIFRPLDMANSYVSGTQAREGGMAEGYRTIFGFPMQVTLPYRTDFLPAYSIVSSSEDLAKYLMMLMNGGQYNSRQIISESALREMVSPSSPISQWVSYGLGWYVTSGSIYHGGDVTNYQSKLKILPDHSLGIILLYNTSSSTLTMLFGSGYRDRIESGIISILFGKDPQPVPLGVSWFDLNRYPMTVTFTMYLGICILVVLALILSALRLKTFQMRLAVSKRVFWSEVLVMLAIHFSLPILMLFSLTQHVSWSYLLFYVPDVGYFSLGVVGCLLLIGITKLYLLLRFMGIKRTASHW